MEEKEHVIRRVPEAELLDHVPEWARVLADAYLAYCEELKPTRTKPSRHNNQATEADETDDHILVLNE